MTLNEMFAGGGAALLVLLTLIQIAPIKVNPWTWLGRSVGKAINGDVLAAQKELAATLEAHIKADKENDVKLARTRFLRFNDEVLRSVKHTKEHFDEILEDIDEYEHYCREHPDFKNNRAGLAIDNIRTTYRRLSDEHGFL